MIYLICRWSRSCFCPRWGCKCDDIVMLLLSSACCRKASQQHEHHQHAARLSPNMVAPKVALRTKHRTQAKGAPHLSDIRNDTPSWVRDETKRVLRNPKANQPMLFFLMHSSVCQPFPRTSGTELYWPKQPGPLRATNATVISRMFSISPLLLR